MNLADIKRDLRVTHSDDDELLQIYLDAAKDQALRFIDRTELPMVEPADPESSSSSSEPVLELPGSIRAALLGRYANVFITDQFTARALLAENR